MRSILGISSAAIMAVLLASTAGVRVAAASPDDCSISGMQGSFACPLSTWTNPPAAQAAPAASQLQAAPAVPQQQAAPPAPQRAESPGTCTPRYQLYSSHLKWINDCPGI